MIGYIVKSITAAICDTSTGLFSDEWKAIQIHKPKFNSYPINNKRGHAAKQKREAKKAKRK